jgi:hypothetical protein
VSRLGRLNQDNAGSAAYLEPGRKSIHPIAQAQAQPPASLLVFRAKAIMVGNGKTKTHSNLLRKLQRPLYPCKNRSPVLLKKLQQSGQASGQCN